MSKEDNYKRLRDFISTQSMVSCIPYLGRNSWKHACFVLLRGMVVFNKHTNNCEIIYLNAFVFFFLKCTVRSYARTLMSNNNFFLPSFSLRIFWAVLLLLFCVNHDAPVFTHAHTHRVISKFRLYSKKHQNINIFFADTQHFPARGCFTKCVLSPCEPSHTRVLEDSSSLVLEL